MPNSLVKSYVFSKNFRYISFKTGRKARIPTNIANVYCDSGGAGPCYSEK